VLRSAEGRIGFAICAVLLFAAAFGRFLTPYDPAAVNLMVRLQGPSTAHWFGTDELGRDLFSRVLAGAGATIPASLAVVGIAIGIGCTLGLVAGYAGGRIDNVIMRLTDMFLGYPSFLLAIAVVSSLGPGLWQAVAALSVLWWAGYARLTRTQARLVRRFVYVEAAQAIGAGDVRMLLRHVLPNVIGPIVVKATIDVSLVVESIAALGFIGLGAQPPSSEWGALIADSRTYALDSWWYPVFPGIVLLVTVLGCNLLGDGLSRLKRSR
jgi:peptide/nickel transport system permease protein